MSCSLLLQRDSCSSSRCLCFHPQQPRTCSILDSIMGTGIITRTHIIDGAIGVGTAAYCRSVTGTSLDHTRVQLTTRSQLINLFKPQVTAHQAAIQTGASYPMLLGTLRIIWQALLAQEQPEFLRWEVETDKSYFGGRHAGCRGRAAAVKDGQCKSVSNHFVQMKELVGLGLGKAPVGLGSAASES